MIVSSLSNVFAENSGENPSRMASSMNLSKKSLNSIFKPLSLNEYYILVFESTHPTKEFCP
jgi:hypothetical protein